MNSAPAARMQTVWRALWTSRLVVIIAGLFGVVQIGTAPDATLSYDPTSLTAPFGYLANAVVAPLARWDSVWYLTIARSGYAGVRERMAFYPLYPLLMHVVGWVTRSQLVAGVLISLVAFGVALWLLHRLICLDLDSEVADATVMLIAFCPMAFFFSAVYTESLFLALSLGCIYAARQERWWLCGVLGFLAALSRNGGIVLIVPAAWIYLYGAGGLHEVGINGMLRGLLRPRRLGPDVLWLVLIPAGLVVYLAYLGVRWGDTLAPFQVLSVWYRHTTFPLTTVWQGVQQAWNGLRELVHGSPLATYVPAYAQGEVSAALQDVYLFLFLVLGVVALVGAFCTLPLAYGLYSLVLLVLTLSDPVSLQPLASLPRYELVIFPLFIWGGRWLTRRRMTTPAIGALAVLLAIFTIEFATWRWVA